MSKFFVLVALSIFTVVTFANDFSRTGTLKHNEDHEPVFVTADEKGLTREFTINNASAFDTDILLLEGKTVKLNGSFKNINKRQGSLVIKKIIGEHLNPLNL